MSLNGQHDLPPWTYGPVAVTSHPSILEFTPRAESRAAEGAEDAEDWEPRADTPDARAALDRLADEALRDYDDGHTRPMDDLFDEDEEAEDVALNEHPEDVEDEEGEPPADEDEEQA